MVYFLDSLLSIGVHHQTENVWCRYDTGFGIRLSPPDERKNAESVV